ncbi:hypothetical protein D3C77_355470 [compost metagenome]
MPLYLNAVYPIQNPVRLQRKSCRRSRSSKLLEQIVVASAAAYRKAKFGSIAFKGHTCIIRKVADHGQINHDMLGNPIILQRIPYLPQMRNRCLGKRIAAKLQRLGANFLASTQLKHALQLVPLHFGQGQLCECLPVSNVIPVHEHLF